jgi:hypothetical protein
MPMACISGDDGVRMEDIHAAHCVVSSLYQCTNNAQSKTRASGTPHYSDSVNSVVFMGVPRVGLISPKTPCYTTHDNGFYHG